MKKLKVSSSVFDTLEVSQDEIIHFSQGIPGLEHLKQFALIDLGEDIPFSYLHSLEDGDVAFLVTDPFSFFSSYEFELPEDAKQELEIAKEDDILLINVVSAKDGLETATVNLLAPIVINKQARLGKQVILANSPYALKQPLFLVKAGG